eukprot:scaffold6999_cov60-Phaeocystis_antarctica.AAC.2
MEAARVLRRLYGRHSVLELGSAAEAHLVRGRVRVRVRVRVKVRVRAWVRVKVRCRVWIRVRVRLERGSAAGPHHDLEQPLQPLAHVPPLQGVDDAQPPKGPHCCCPSACTTTLLPAAASRERAAAIDEELRSGGPPPTPATPATPAPRCGAGRKTLRSVTVWMPTSSE